MIPIRSTNVAVVLRAAQVPGTSQDHLQVFNIETKAKMKSYQMSQQVRICNFVNDFDSRTI